MRALTDRIEWTKDAGDNWAATVGGETVATVTRRADGYWDGECRVKPDAVRGVRTLERARDEIAHHLRLAHFPWLS